MSPTRDLRTTFIVALALVAMTLKLAIAYNTIGTNDASSLTVAPSSEQHGLHDLRASRISIIRRSPLTICAASFAHEQPWCQDSDPFSVPTSMPESLPISSLFDPVTVPQDQHPHSDLGARALCAQSFP